MWIAKEKKITHFFLRLIQVYIIFSWLLFIVKDHLLRRTHLLLEKKQNYFVKTLPCILQISITKRLMFIENKFSLIHTDFFYYKFIVKEK